MFSSIKVDSERVNPLTIIAAVIIIFLSVIPFIKNYKYNDNHLAWLNHDYGKNLMMSTELGSVFMTEGGDNQVFSTLYFIYAEKLRPDLSPYDQKGNIFKRIYGDMRYIDPQTLNRRMQMVDAHLFAGEEPFYVNIRDRADPYFIPYWQGRRPVYLTWQRPEPWTLSTDPQKSSIADGKTQQVPQEIMGNYYYKRYGIMYKVQDIEYSLVDYLELKKEISLSDAQAHFASMLHRAIDAKFTMEKVQKMEKEGYLKLSGNMVKFVKMYDSPHNVDYFDKLLLRWHAAPNAMYWDVLTREIIINYDYQLGEIYRDKIGELQDIRSRETRPAIIAEIDKRIKENWELAKGYYNDALKYGSDSISILHNLSVVYMRNGIENLDDKAKQLLTRALDMYQSSWGTYSLMFTFLLNDCFKNPANEAVNMKEIDRLMLQLKKNLTYYKSSQGDYTKHEVWKSFAGIDNFITVMKQVSITQMDSMQKELTRQITQTPNAVDGNLAQQVVSLLYSRGFPFQYQPYINKADAYLNQLINLKKNDPNFMSWAFSIEMQLQRIDKAYAYGKILEKVLKPVPDPTFYFSMGLMAYNLNLKSDAKVYLNSFLDKIKDDRKALIQLRDPVQKAKDMLAAINLK